MLLLWEKLSQPKAPRYSVGMVGRKSTERERQTLTDRLTEGERERERQRDRQRQRETDRQTDGERRRQTDRQKDRRRETETERDRQTDRDRDIQREKERESKKEIVIRPFIGESHFSSPLFQLYMICSNLKSFRSVCSADRGSINVESCLRSTALKRDHGRTPFTSPHPLAIDTKM